MPVAPPLRPVRPQASQPLRPLPMRERLPGWTRGLVAGTVATLPMTVWMSAVRRQLPALQRAPLPPFRIVRALARKSVIGLVLGRKTRHRLALAAHYGYGAAAGAVYGAWANRRQPGVLPAIAFGLLVWAVSYQGFLPRLGLHRAATAEPKGRNLMLITGHVVWGATLGAVERLLAPPLPKRPELPSPGRLQATAGAVPQNFAS